MISSEAKATAVAALCLPFLLAIPAAAQDGQSPADRAYALFQESVTKYREGRFEEAAALLEEANQLDPDPILTYNLARAYEGMGDFARAVAAYEGYLHDSPDAADRGAVEARVETLRRELRERERLRNGPGGEQTETETEGGDLSAIAPFFLLGLGVAGIGVGAVFGILSNEAHEDAVSSPDFTSAYVAQEDAEALATGANVSFVLGAAALAAGALWLVLDAGSDGEDGEDARVSVTAGPNTAGISVAHTW